MARSGPENVARPKIGPNAIQYNQLLTRNQQQNGLRQIDTEVESNQPPRDVSACVPLNSRFDVDDLRFRRANR